ncbi:MAG: zf-HC2 domain-containing protein [Candidatus Tectomicrobia bacterium]|jgi:anti-sigma factor RsiW|nr:zf-HC2 domain-containing protein [Candidatus Tectomicrobia bacterium]
MAQQHRTANSSRARLTCEQVTKLIRDYLQGELPPDLTASFEEHLRCCDDCVAFLKTYKQTVQEVQSLTYEDVPQDMQIRVRQFLRANMKKSPPSR